MANPLATAITALVTLLGVLLGGWLSIRNQERLHRRDHAREWRDIRLTACGDFLTALREFIAFTLEPGITITTAPHPKLTGELMPFFDEKGSPYKEKLEATKTRVRLVSESADTVAKLNALVRKARGIAAARATHGVGEVPHELFEALWAAERDFVAAVRAEVGLPAIPIS
ncbi:hypothetical protein NLX83_05585 [Allokutzneria sp. A3M-2-11 16]|uniref:hypothetical protein n=1 Tax=Allokutzneria sp. A3M-2-11 16 TaxID=2962043 RepID=UPI0020B688C9|nr:hypothetical protein [Allokutzneria sp. A3M-2-11 16]MCP3798724.1 hypothetical protein [Allokutzneria sp. A3M-2-11 16]